MNSRRVLILAIATQSFLILLAYALSRAFAIPPRWGSPARDVATGLIGAAVLALINHQMLTRAPANWLVDGVRTVYHDVLVPLFSRFDPASIVLIGIMAGVGEEWLFRGVLLPAVGWLLSSIAFGVAHIGGRSMIAFGAWASGMGLVLGGLALLTGGLIAPIVAHAVYDMLALAYLRRGAQRA